MFKAISNFAEDHPKAFNVAAHFGVAATGAAMIGLHVALMSVFPASAFLGMLGVAAIGGAAASAVLRVGFALLDVILDRHHDVQSKRRKEQRAQRTAQI